MPAGRKDVRMFTEYFDSATYHQWDDIEPPIVSVSHGASGADYRKCLNALKPVVVTWC